MNRPPYDPAVAAALDALGPPPALTPEHIAERRQPDVAVARQLDEFDVQRRDVKATGYQGAQLEMSVYARRGHTGNGPGKIGRAHV